MNQQPITITATVAVWTRDSEYNGISDVLANLEAGRHQRVVDSLIFYGAPDSKTFGDYIRFGEADVIVRLLPRDEQTRIAVQTLNDKLTKLRAAYVSRQQEILAQISKLQALTNEADATDESVVDAEVRHVDA